ncbi:MAG TPA: hypothetical protein VGQ52_18110 [Gemmatimonadaceae bacterium]|nr:hypothetical protein [Gemmatimonadaceae bacterium]
MWRASHPCGACLENEDAERRLVRVLRNDGAAVVVRFGQREAGALPNEHSAAEVDPVRDDGHRM